MQYVTSREVALPRLSINLGSFECETVADVGSTFSGYAVSQRLSDDHSPIRVENVANYEAFPRVRSVSFLPSGCPVRLYPVAKPFRILSCVFEKRFFEGVTEIQQGLWQAHSDAFATIENPRVETSLEQIYAELVQPGFGSDLVIESAGNVIAVEMARCGRQQLGMRSAHSAYAKGGLAPWQLRRIQDRVEASLDAGYPSLGELAELCCISQNHLMRAFKASTGMQVHKYVAGERLKAAQQMLARDQLSPSQISARLGFCSPAYFTTAFRRMTGLTPTDFRRRACSRSPTTH